jgi:hypothetical protein
MSRNIINSYLSGLLAPFFIVFLCFFDKSGKIAGFHSPIVRLLKQTVLAFQYKRAGETVSADLR